MITQVVTLKFQLQQEITEFTIRNALKPYLIDKESVEVIEHPITELLVAIARHIYDVAQIEEKYPLENFDVMNYLADRNEIDVKFWKRVGILEEDSDGI